jgi:hypothetical protein
MPVRLLAARPFRMIATDFPRDHPGRSVVIMKPALLAAGAAADVRYR